MITTVTTVTTVAAIELTVAITTAATISLIAFLVSKELAHTNRSGVFMRIAKFVNVAILPLVMAFAAIVALKITSILLA